MDSKNELPVSLIWIAGAFFTLIGVLNVLFKGQIAAWNDRKAVKHLGSDPARRNAYPSVKIAGIAMLAFGVVLLAVAIIITAGK